MYKMNLIVSIVFVITVNLIGIINVFGVNFSNTSLCTLRHQWSVSVRELYIPNLEEISQVLRNQLQQHFRFVDVSVEMCPDLRQEPYALSQRGFGGNARLLDVGSLSNILPLVNRSKIYDLGDLVQHAELEEAFVFGAGAGPWPDIGTNGEGIYIYNYQECTLHQHSSVAIVDDSVPSGYRLVNLLPTSRSLAITAALFASSGMRTNILRITLRQRTSEAFEITSGIRQILAQYYGPGRTLGLGMIFVVRAGTARIQIMPDFSTVPLVGPNAFADWVSYFNMSAPLVAFGTIVTNDMNLHLYTPHFHLRSNHGQGGHWHYDVTPETVEYDILINFGQSLYRIDQPLDQNLK